MGKANFSDEFKRDAVAQITERGYSVQDDLLSCFERDQEPFAKCRVYN
jgi:hypothetical protein